MRSEVNAAAGTENAAATQRKTGPPTQFSDDETLDVVVAKYEGTRYNELSREAQDIVRRIDAGEIISADELMRLPEVQQAERESEGTRTIDLPNREQIQDEAYKNEAYKKAMEHGSYSGKDADGNDTFNGPINHDKRIDIVIGLPGSGKSSVYSNRISQKFGSRIIDTDDYRGYIPEYNGRNSRMVHEEASSIKRRVLNESLDNGDNILLSVIGDDAIKLEGDIQGFVDDGYSVYLHLNELSNEKALNRAAKRFLLEGRYVPFNLIVRYGDKPTQTYLALTGQEGAYDGRTDGRGEALAGNAGQGARAGYGNVQGASRTEKAPLAGYDWYNNDVEKGQKARLISEYSTDTGINETRFSTDEEEYVPDNAAEYSRERTLEENRVPESAAEYARMKEQARARDEKTSLAEYAVNVVGQEYVREGRETCPLFFLRYV